jgi:hypothetical protein
VRRAELRENVEETIMALTGLAMAQSRVDLRQQYETLSKATALVESSMRDGRPNPSVFKHTFYRLGLACSALLQQGHYCVYSASKKAGVDFAQEKWQQQPSAPGGKKDQVHKLFAVQPQPSSPTHTA